MYGWLGFNIWMDGRSNKVKNKTPFKKWFDEKTMEDKESYLENNYWKI